MLYDCNVIIVKSELDKAFDRMNKITLKYCNKMILRDLLNAQKLHKEFQIAQLRESIK